MITAAYKKPIPKNLPENINPDAIDIWKKVTKENKDYIDDFDTNEDKWAAATILFKRACARKRIKPFIDKEEKDDLFLYISQAEDALPVFNKIVKHLYKKDLIKKPKPLKVIETDRHRKKKRLHIGKVMEFKQKAPIINAVRLLTRNNFVKSGDMLRRKFNKTTVYCYMDTERVLLYFHILLDKDISIPKLIKELRKER